MSTINLQQITEKGSIQSLKYLFKYIKPYHKSFTVMMLALIISSSSVLMIAKSMQYVIDNGLSKGDSNMLNQALMYLGVIILILAVATSLRFYLITLIGERAIADIRRDLYLKILTLSPSFFEHNRVGEILSRITNDTTLLQLIIGSSLSIAMRNIIMFTGGVILLLTINMKLCAMIALIIPIIVLPIVFFGKQMRKYSKMSQDKVAEVAAHVEETINGIKAVQSFTHEQLETDRFNSKLNDVIDASLKRIKTRSILTAMIITLAFGAVGVIMWIGGHKVLSGEITSGELSSFIFLSVVCATSLGALADVIGNMQKAGGATERLVEFLNIEPDIKDIQGAKHISDSAGATLRFSNVSFSYPSRKDKKCLDNISFDIEPNTVTAIVGESGAGKSTLFQLLMRFYDITDGHISFDQVDIKEFTLKSLRQQFGYVSQDPVIFSASAYDNILYGNINATYEQVKEAANAAAAIEFIEKLPHDFDTYLGEKGMRLSGGQKQRIAIARAFLKNPKILLLDEATSALDTKNEELVQKALENVTKDRTTIVIAHRLSTVVKADKIIVMKEGRIIEAGTHYALMKIEGEYSKLVNTQIVQD